MPVIPARNATAGDASESSSSLLTNVRVGLRSKSITKDDLILIREVFVEQTHVAPQEETCRQFKVVASKANACRKLSFAVMSKSAEDRYKRLQARADEVNKREALTSDVGGKVGAAEELLSAMREARDDIIQSWEERRRVASEREVERERLGAIVCEHPLKSQNRSANQDSG